MNILITNRVLAGRSGTEVVVRDLALGLRQRGHHPVVYSPVLGPMADEIRANDVPVYRDLREVTARRTLFTGITIPRFLPACCIFQIRQRFSFVTTQFRGMTIPSSFPESSGMWQWIIAAKAASIKSQDCRPGG